MAENSNLEDFLRRNVLAGPSAYLAHAVDLDHLFARKVAVHVIQFLFVELDFERTRRADDFFRFAGADCQWQQRAMSMATLPMPITATRLPVEKSIEA